MEAAGVFRANRAVSLDTAVTEARLGDARLEAAALVLTSGRRWAITDLAARASAVLDGALVVRLLAAGVGRASSAVGLSAVSTSTTGHVALGHAETHVVAGLFRAVRGLDGQASDVGDLASVARSAVGVASAHSAFAQDAVVTSARHGGTLGPAIGLVAHAVLVDPLAVSEVTLGAVSGGAALRVVTVGDAVGLDAAGTVALRLSAGILAEALVSAGRRRARRGFAARLCAIALGADIARSTSGVCTASSAVRLLAVAASALGHVTRLVAEALVGASGLGAVRELAAASLSAVLDRALVASFAKRVFTASDAVSLDAVLAEAARV